MCYNDDINSNTTTTTKTKKLQIKYENEQHVKNNTIFKYIDKKTSKNKLQNIGGQHALKTNKKTNKEEEERRRAGIIFSVLLCA